MKFVSTCLLVFSFLVFGLTTAIRAEGARVPVLDLPLKCTIGVDCFLQHFMDAKPGKAAADYTCGSLSYNNHRGTDIRIQTLAQMEKGVPVIAAEEGTVTGIRRGVKDQYYSDYSKKKKKEIYNIGLGNVVVLDHGGKWTTFYAHMQKGSIKVYKGQRVQKGEVLGYVGMSGLTDFPHLHFELRHKNKRIDPFTGLEKNEKCGNFKKNYWSDNISSQLTYTPTFFVNIGFSETRPSGRRDLETGKKNQDEFGPMAPTLFFWSYYIGSRKGDKISLKLFDPAGKIIGKHITKPMGKHQISRNLFIGVKKPATGWKNGIYRGEVAILRGDERLTNSASITQR
ncbi:hypothetical protein A9Q83_07560 [Alphaproteobacteria bacterium 46_93_T64]|nr:hypothetical protein A9Q83_07560 [Alphaproteobacteria bacterium 46_93_T64]